MLFLVRVTVRVRIRVRVRVRVRIRVRVTVRVRKLPFFDQDGATSTAGGQGGREKHIGGAREKHIGGARAPLTPTCLG